MTCNEEVVVLGLRAIKKLSPNFDIHEACPSIYALAEKNAYNADLLSILGSWGDTLEDQEIAELLKDFNKTGQIFSQIWARAESPREL